MAKARQLAVGKAKAQEILDYMEQLYRSFENAGYRKYIMYDMGIVQKIDYYTGIVFRGYIEGVGIAVLSGGRYDSLYCNYGKSRNACGFTVDISAIAESTETKKRQPGRTVNVDLNADSIAAAIAEIDKAKAEGYKIDIEI